MLTKLRRYSVSHQGADHIGIELGEAATAQFFSPCHFSQYKEWLFDQPFDQPWDAIYNQVTRHIVQELGGVWSA